MEMEQLRPGLWRWTAPHPAWRQGADWPRDVNCVYYETTNASVLIDPLVSDADDEASWHALDETVERAKRRTVVVLTAPWHSRSSDDVFRRYEAEIVPADAVPAIRTLAVPPVEERQLALLLENHNAIVTALILPAHGQPVLADACRVLTAAVDGWSRQR